MAVSPESLIAPRGEIETNLFPGEVIANRLEEYIREGTAKTSSLSGEAADNALKAYVYYRAFRAVYIRLSADPSQATLVDQGARQYSADQVSRFRTMANDFYTQFQDLVLTPAESVSPPPSVSSRVRNAPVW